MAALILRTALLFISSTAVATGLSSFDQVRDHRKLPLYQDPCTGSWSNDVQTLKNTDCSIETAAITKVDEDEIIDPTMDCSIKSPPNPSLAQKLNTLEFWYAVEVTEPETESWMDLLEDKIYELAFTRMSFCIALGQRRQRRSLLSRRDLGILSVTSNPPDRHRTDVACPSALDIGNNEYCYVVQGKLNLLARTTDDVSYTFASMIEAIKEASAPNTALLGSDISTVTNVTYLGTTKSDVESWTPSSAILPPGRDDGFLPVDSRKNGAVISVVTIGAMVVLVLLILFVWRRRQDVDSQDLLCSTSDEDSNVDEIKNRIGTGDDTRNLVLANSKELGAGHSGVNVHKCSSSTCEVCQAGFRNVGMVGFERFNPNEAKNVIVPMEDIDEDLRIVETRSSYSSEAFDRDRGLQGCQRSSRGMHYSQSALSSTSEEDADSEVLDNGEDSVELYVV